MPRQGWFARPRFDKDEPGPRVALVRLLQPGEQRPRQVSRRCAAPVWWREHKPARVECIKPLIGGAPSTEVDLREGPVQVLNSFKELQQARRVGRSAADVKSMARQLMLVSFTALYAVNIARLRARIPALSEFGMMPELRIQQA